jgi:hypothetical protein
MLNAGKQFIVYYKVFELLTLVYWTQHNKRC